MIPLKTDTESKLAKSNLQTHYVWLFSGAVTKNMPFIIFLKIKFHLIFSAVLGVVGRGTKSLPLSFQ